MSNHLAAGMLNLTAWQVTFVPLVRMVIALDGFGITTQLIWAQVSSATSL